jgi:hypothetical protein
MFTSRITRTHLLPGGASAGIKSRQLSLRFFTPSSPKLALLARALIMCQILLRHVRARKVNQYRARQITSAGKLIAARFSHSAPCFHSIPTLFLRGVEICAD